MPAVIRSLEVAVPLVVLRQEELRDVFAAQPGISALSKRLIRAAFDYSGIERRHTVMDELDLAAALAAAPETPTPEALTPEAPTSEIPTPDASTSDAPAPDLADSAPGAAADDAAPVFFDRRAREILAPSTGVRNAFYAREAPRLFVEAARAAVAACPGLEPAAVTHLVTASCTGFYAPGPDLDVVRALGLPRSVKRSHLGFMGCYAAFPALRQAAEICGSDPDAVVLVVCAELCSIHLRTANDPDTIRGASLFADGAAAAVVTAPDDARTGDGGNRGSSPGGPTPGPSRPGGPPPRPPPPAPPPPPAAACTRRYTGNSLPAVPCASSRPPRPQREGPPAAHGRPHEE
ncbi:hypothetical protein NBM05_15010, partial [Rothia sp. AR01]|nr:hypothetical protein [Rothia santali]